MTLNGKLIGVADGVTLSDLLIREEYTISRIAVELNGMIIPRSKYEEVILHNADVLEVVSFVGGG